MCHGILPQVVSRNEKVLVVCNSNVVVDASMMKCFNDVDLLKTKILHSCSFKANIDDKIIVDEGLYAEGSDESSIMDEYGNLPGCNSNTSDLTVQNQI